jgi:hypothetical protein
MSVFWFWALFVIIGLPVISIIWTVFKFITLLLVRFVRKVCPYKKFAVSISEIIAFGQGGWFLYRFYTNNEWHGAIKVVWGITIACLVLSLSFLLSNALRKTSA